MRSHSSLTTAELLAVFTEEVGARGGSVTNTFHQGGRLFTRSVLPHTAEVRPGDRVQGGVALKATDEEVCLCPYVFRLVCSNGAIVAQTLGSRSLEYLHQQEPETALHSVRKAIEACSAPEVFTENVGKMRTASEAQVDLALNLMPLLSRFPTAGTPELLSQVMEQFFREGDQSQFGLANAVTAVARETRDPDLRWNLEEFGGGIAVGILPPAPTDGARAVRERVARAASATRRGLAGGTRRPVLAGDPGR